LDDVLPRCDVVNVLRIQFERQQGGLFPSVAEYSQFYMMTKERLDLAKDDLLLLAPGPINRGVELTPEVADGRHSAILDQVTNGLAVRMAVLYLLGGRMGHRGSARDETDGSSAGRKESGPVARGTGLDRTRSGRPSEPGGDPRP